MCPIFLNFIGFFGLKRWCWQWSSALFTGSVSIEAPSHFHVFSCTSQTQSYFWASFAFFAILGDFTTFSTCWCLSSFTWFRQSFINSSLETMSKYCQKRRFISDSHFVCLFSDAGSFINYFFDWKHQPLEVLFTSGLLITLAIGLHCMFNQVHYLRKRLALFIKLKRAIRSIL